MRILLTNDDGIHAPGLAVLEEVASELSDDIWVCAPAEEKSGAGHALSLAHPVRLRRYGPRRFSVSGTPTDSVVLALREVMDAPPDLILSGINHGANLGDDITYSGTVAAAMEGALAGIPSIALSQVYARGAMADALPFSAARQWMLRAITPLIGAELPPRTLVNINFPACAAEKVKGIRVVPQGFHDYSRGSVVKGRDPRGSSYYWFGLHANEPVLERGSDLEAIDEGYISVTPLELDLTHHDSLGALEGRYSQ